MLLVSPSFPVRFLRQPRSDRRSHIYVAATHNVGLPQALRNRARKRRLFPDTFALPGAVLETVRTPGLRHPFVVQINSRASRSLTERFRRRSSASKSVVGPPQQRGKDARRAARSDGRRRRATRRISEPNPFWPPKLQAKRLWSTEFAGQRFTA